MIKVSDEVRSLMMNNLVVPAELLMLRNVTQDRDASFILRTNAPFDIEHEGIVYRKGLYPLVAVATPDNATFTERSILQLQVLDVNWALRDEFLLRGPGRLRIEMRLALLRDDYSIAHVLDMFRGHCVTAQSSVGSDGPVASLGFAGPLDKLSAERVLVVSDNSQRQRDAGDSSMKSAHISRSLRWSH